MTPSPRAETHHLVDLLAAVTGEQAPPGVLAAEPVDRRDRFLTLLAIYDLHTAPLTTLGDRARFQHHPAVAELKGRLETEWIDELRAVPPPADLPRDPVQAMRALAARDRLPAPYRWLAKEASYEEMVAWLALEGGPDGGFDDLVAACQTGLDGSAKLELAKNYWDEMGNGTFADIHTELHRKLARALDFPEVPREVQPVAGLERSALGGLLATNRWLQPEMLGALGMIELQAGPRCQLVLQGFDRVGVPAEAYPFYVVHAEVDPTHGKDWLDKAVAPLAAEQPLWGGRMLVGAWWRLQVNAAFFRAADHVARGVVAAA